MSDKEGQHKTIELSGGEILYLTKDPGGKWMIDFYECHQGANGLVFKTGECRPRRWKTLEFESAAKAVAFAERSPQPDAQELYTDVYAD